MASLPGLPELARKRRVLLPVQAFVDESGGPGQGPVIVLVGVIGKSEEWAEFSDRWRAALARPPAIRSLHMREAAHFRGEFRGWSRQSRDERVRLLAGIVNDFQFTAIHCSADLSGFAETIAASASRPISEPYFLCFHSMIMAICYELLEQGQKERFEIIFDENVVLGPRVKLWYPVIRSVMEPEDEAIMPVEPIFGSDEELLPLQVSDLLAWLIRRELSGLDHSFDWIPRAMNGLVWSGHRQTFDRERMNGIVEMSMQMPVTNEMIRRYKELLGRE